LYDTLWAVNGVQLADPSNTQSTALAPLNRTISHFDPHVAFVLRPNTNTSVRLATGTSTTFPFVGQVSGLATYEEPACSLGPPFADGGTLTEKNPNLNPETSIGYSAGADFKLKNNSVLSVDLLDTVVHGVFEQLTTEVPVDKPTICGTPEALEGVFFPANVARLSAKSVTVKYNFAPRKGFGLNFGVTAESSILNGLTPNLFTPGVPSVPANDIQICGNGVAAPGIATCIPYLQGYGQITWAQPNGWFVGLGADYQGKNNAYFQPPFAVADFVARKPVGRYAELQVSVQNLLNTNNYGAYLPIPGAGTPLVANTTNAGFTELQQTSYTPSLVPAAARTVRLQLRLHTR
jgi:outer membrane receptor protein involved in Fe transport